MKKIALLLAVLMLTIGLSSCTSYKKGDTTVLMTVGGAEVTHELYRFICLKNAAILASGQEDYFTGKDADAHLQELQSAVDRELRLYFAVETLAKRYEVTLSKEDVDLIKDEIKETKKQSQSKKEYYDGLEKLFMSENVFFEQAKNYYLERNLFYFVKDEKNGVILLSDDQLRKDVAEHFFAAGQILLTGEGAEALAESLKKQLEDGADFYALALEHSKDSIKDVRYFTYGEMQPYFEQAVKELQIGQVSEVIKSDLGWHLIKREQPDMDYVEKNLEIFRDTDLVRLYNEMLAKEAESLKIVCTDAYSGLIIE